MSNAWTKSNSVEITVPASLGATTEEAARHFATTADRDVDRPRTELID